MGICDSTKNKRKNNKKLKINLPEQDAEKSEPENLPSDFVEDNTINEKNYELLDQNATDATKEEIQEAIKNKTSNNSNNQKLKTTKKIHYKFVKIDKKSDGTVIRTTIENGKKIIETFKPKNKTHTDTGENKTYTNVINSHIATPHNDNNNKDNKNNNNNVKGNNFQEEALKAHNEYRRKHHSPNLILNNDLNRIAQNYANKIAKVYSVEHSNNEFKGEPLGENIYMCQGMKPTGKEMTKKWYDEINKYNFNSKKFISGTGHFTQIVWKNSKEVGFGIAQSKDGSYFCVANYYPCGNFLGEFDENVLKP